MSAGLCQHPWHNLRITDLLRGGTHQWQGLPSGLDEHWRWLLQKEKRAPGDLLTLLVSRGGGKPHHSALPLRAIVDPALNAGHDHRAIATPLPLAEIRS